MKRRDFVAACAAFALFSRDTFAQAKVFRIGFLILANPEPYATFLKDALAEFGYVAGRNAQLDFRTADGKPALLAKHADELVRAKMDLILCVQTPVIKALIQATKQIPIVFLAGNPVETGIVTNLSRPGGNATGLSLANLELTAKTLELTREILPSLRRVAALINADDLAFGKPMLDQTNTAAKSLGLEVHPAIVHAQEIEAAMHAIAKSRVQAAVVQPSLPRERVIELALQHRLPLISSSAAWAPAGALVTYAPDLRDACRKAVDYADRILKGARPGELPIQQPTKFELVINQKTARAIGLSVPQSVLVRADRVIE
jgi:putative ABC transport system substrate-binding protein